MQMHAFLLFVCTVVVPVSWGLKGLGFGAASAAGSTEGYLDFLNYANFGVGAPALVPWDQEASPQSPEEEAKPPSFPLPEARTSTGTFDFNPPNPTTEISRSRSTRVMRTETLRTSTRKRNPLVRPPRDKLRGVKTIVLGLVLATAVYVYFYVGNNHGLPEAYPKSYEGTNVEKLASTLEHRIKRLDEILGEKFVDLPIYGLTAAAFLIVAVSLCLSGLVELGLSLRRQLKAYEEGPPSIRGLLLVGIGAVILALGANGSFGAVDRDPDEPVRDGEVLWVPVGLGLLLGGTLLAVPTLVQRKIYRRQESSWMKEVAQEVVAAFDEEQDAEDGEK